MSIMNIFMLYIQQSHTYIYKPSLQRRIIYEWTWILDWNWRSKSLMHVNNTKYIWLYKYFIPSIQSTYIYPYPGYFYVKRILCCKDVYREKRWKKGMMLYTYIYIYSRWYYIYMLLLLLCVCKYEISERWKWFIIFYCWYFIYNKVWLVIHISWLAQITNISVSVYIFIYVYLFIN